MKQGKRNGSITAHGRQWPLYERFEDGVMVLFMRPEDRAEKEQLDEQSLKSWTAARSGRNGSSSL